MNERLFQTPKELIDPNVLQRLEANGAADRILRSQKRTLRSLVSENRAKRMAELAENGGDDHYLPVDMLSDVTGGIWSELDTVPVACDLYRRNLQRAHVELLTGFVEQEKPSSDLPDLCRGELRTILDRIYAVNDNCADRTTELHLRGIASRLGVLLDPRLVIPTELPRERVETARGD